MTCCSEWLKQKLSVVVVYNTLQRDAHIRFHCVGQFICEWLLHRNTTKSHKSSLLLKQKKTIGLSPANACIYSYTFTYDQVTKTADTSFNQPLPKTSRYTQTSRLCVLQKRSYWQAKFAGIGTFQLFLLLWPWPWPDHLHIRIWPVFHGDIPDVQIRTSYIKAFASYRRTDTHTDRLTDRTVNYITPIHGWSKISTLQAGLFEQDNL